MKIRNKKTGEIITIKSEGELALLELIKNSLPNGLNVWEEVKEPLIKDEKIRKAVRAWAEAEGELQVQVTHCRRRILSIYGLTRENGNIDFDCNIEPFDEGTYTIAELCGEEE